MRIALVVMSPRKLIGAEIHLDLNHSVSENVTMLIFCIGKLCLETIGAEFVRDVKPGEVVTINGRTDSSDMTNALRTCKQARCIFEYIYFARPDSHLTASVFIMPESKQADFLAQDSPVEADLVVGVPESGNAAALGYAMESAFHTERHLSKTVMSGRTFIKPKQSSRESSVRVKLNV